MIEYDKCQDLTERHMSSKTNEKDNKNELRRQHQAI